MQQVYTYLHSNFAYTKGRFTDSQYYTMWPMQGVIHTSQHRNRTMKSILVSACITVLRQYYEPALSLCQISRQILYQILIEFVISLKEG